MASVISVPILLSRYSRQGQSKRETHVLSIKREVRCTEIVNKDAAHFNDFFYYVFSAKRTVKMMGRNRRSSKRLVCEER